MAETPYSYSEDFPEYESRRAALKEYLAQWDAVSNRISQVGALQAANAARLAVNPSREVIAGIGLANTNMDEQLVAAVLQRDAAQQQAWWQRILAGTSRVVTGGFQMLYDEGVTRPMRTALRGYQQIDRGEGFSFGDVPQLWREAGPSTAAAAGALAIRGEPVDIGTGYLMESTPLYERPGVGLSIAQNVQAGMSFEDASQTAIDQSIATQGIPISRIAQDWRESTLVSKDSPSGVRTTPFSPGRALAVQVTDPGTIAFNVASGLVDFASVLALDPLNVPATEAAIALRGRHVVVPHNVDPASFAGISAKRPWIHPTFADDFWASKRGRRVAEWFADNRSLSRQLRYTSSLPEHSQRALLYATTTDEVVDVFDEFLGYAKMPKAPSLRRTDRMLTRLGANVPLDTHGLAGGIARFVDDSPYSRTMRRLLAETQVPALAVDDFASTAPIVNDMLDTIGAPVHVKDRVLEQFLNARGDYVETVKAYESFRKVLKRRLGELGYDEEIADGLMRSTQEAQVYAQHFYDDTLGNRRIEYGQHALVDENTGEILLWQPDAHLESEFGLRYLIVPNVRELRRLTSRAQVLRNKARMHFGADPVGTEGFWITSHLLDPAAATWRNMMLARLGWSMRVLPEELVRQNAAGYTQMFTHPAQYMAFILNRAGMNGVDGTDLTKLRDSAALGSGGGFQTTISGLPLGGGRASTRTSRTPVPRGHPYYWDGLREEIYVMWGDELNREIGKRIADGMSDDEIFRWLRGIEEYTDDPSGPALLRSRARGAKVTSNYRDIMYDDMVLRAKIQSVQARRHQLAGGRTLTRELDRTVSPATRFTGRWIDEAGNPIGPEHPLFQELRLDEVPETEVSIVLSTPDELDERMLHLITYGSEPLYLDQPTVAVVNQAWLDEADELDLIYQDLQRLADEYPNDYGEAFAIWDLDPDAALASLVERHFDELSDEAQEYFSQFGDVDAEHIAELQERAATLRMGATEEITERRLVRLGDELTDEWVGGTRQALDPYRGRNGRLVDSNVDRNPDFERFVYEETGISPYGEAIPEDPDELRLFLLANQEEGGAYFFDVHRWRQAGLDLDQYHELVDRFRRRRLDEITDVDSLTAEVTGTIDEITRFLDESMWMGYQHRTLDEIGEYGDAAYAQAVIEEGIVESESVYYENWMSELEEIVNRVNTLAMPDASTAEINRATRAFMDELNTRFMARQNDPGKIRRIKNWARKELPAPRTKRLTASERVAREAEDVTARISEIEARIERTRRLIYEANHPSDQALIDDIFSRPEDFDAMTPEELRALDERAARRPGRLSNEEQATLLETIDDDLAEIEELKAIKGELAAEKLRLRTPKSGQNRIRPGMSDEELAEFTTWLSEWTDPQRIPKSVDVVDSQLNARVQSEYDRFFNFIFSALMEKPTNRLIRSPFARVRYTEEIARSYIFADDAARAEILRWADTENVRVLFDDFVNRHMAEYGISELPTVAADEAFDFTEASYWATNRAVEDTRTLFYDLAKKGNWADMIRFAAPFADAWWEVLSRWAKMLDPTGLIPGRTPGSLPQAWRNLHRISQGIDAGRSNGFFHKDEFGNEVFFFPGFALLPLADELAASASLEQLLFIDPTARGVMLPGAGPFLQVPAAVVQKMLPAQFRDALNWMVYGEFTPPSLDDPGDLVAAVVPTYFKRMYQYIMDGAHDQEYADEMLNLVTAKQIEGDPAYDVTTPEGRSNAFRFARSSASQLALFRIFDAFIMPAQARYEPEVFLPLADHPDAGYLITIAALSREYAAMRQIFGDNVAAQQAFTTRFGFDPMYLVPESIGLLERPVDKSQWQFLIDHPALTGDIEVGFNRTLMAWLPTPEKESFFYQAWIDQFGGDEPARIKTSLEAGADILTQRLGFARLDKIRSDRDEALEAIDAMYEKGTSERADARALVQEWYSRAVDDLASEMVLFNRDGGIEWIPEGATPEKGFKELLAAGNPLTAAYDLGRQINPELSEWAVKVYDLNEQLESVSLNLPGTETMAEWWRTGTSQEALMLRMWFRREVMEAFAEIDDLSARNGARWYIDRVIEPILAGYDPDEPFFHVPEEIPTKAPYLSEATEQYLLDLETIGGRSDG